MKTPRFSGPFKWSALRQQLLSLREDVQSIQKVAGRNVTIDEHRGKGKVINARRDRAAAATGACCVGTDCSIRTEASCTEIGGTYMGDDTTCDPNPCGCTLHESAHICFQWWVQDNDGNYCRISVDEDISVDVLPDEEGVCFMDQSQSTGQKGLSDYDLLSQTVVPAGASCGSEVTSWIAGMYLETKIRWFGTTWGLDWFVHIPNYPGGAVFSYGTTYFGSVWTDITNASLFPISDDGTCDVPDPPGNGESITFSAFTLV